MTADADAESLAALEAALGIRFHDRRLLRTALTHRSFVNEVEAPDSDDNERLEYLGDALLAFVAADLLYRALPGAREGELTALRAALVCEPSLAAFARRIGLGDHLRLGRGEAASGGRDRPGVLCDGFEALMGALYLDQGGAAAEAVVIALFQPALEALLAGRWLKDAKSRFQEVAQRLWQTTPEYHTESEQGPDHDKTFVVTVYTGDVAWGTGEGRSKADAARRAAQSALDRLAGDRPETLPDA